ncbi:MAG: phosphoribosylformylglycinamidine synthase I [Parcubacteria group bacterium]|nr:phosphoribosylformylglycinamidine synthase I [Parcubacteria group bacterium]
MFFRNPAVAVLILKAPGTNCDGETKAAFDAAGARADIIYIAELFRDKKLLRQYQILVLPGGFSYGDDISSGKILANELIVNLQTELDEFLNARKLIIGICNGFQALCKMGLLPGLPRWRQTATITDNDSQRFECRWVKLNTSPSRCLSTAEPEKTQMELPVAHGEGKFFCSAEALPVIFKERLVVFQYDGPPGKYPENPNGSLANIAGICDMTGQILGLMPHPERNSFPWQGNGQCLKFFQSAVDYCQRRL